METNTMDEQKLADDSNKVISPMRSIHMIPMDMVNGFEVRPGMYEVNGNSLRSKFHGAVLLGDIL